MKAARWVLATAVALLAAIPVCAAAPAPNQALSPESNIPFIKGLTTVFAVTEDRGDYESLHAIVSVGKDGYRLHASAQVPDAQRPYAATRIVTTEDQAGSHRIRLWFYENDPGIFPDTVPGFSAEMLQQLVEQGQTRLTYQAVTGGLFGSFVRRELTGTMHRVGPGQEPMRMLVNGDEVELQVIHAKGKLSDANGTEEFEVYVLNDPANPLLLGSNGVDHKSKVVRIEYPVPKAANNSIEQQLARGETVEIHSVYFDFASAGIRPESKRVLQEIAAILGRHPNWRLKIDGHTDAIGNGADNRTLSQARAAAVKSNLVGTYGIDANRLATSGHGESQPKDTNETAEGRSHNRRVELRRL